MNKKILIIAAHPDDEIIGCGGTLLKHIFNKDDVFVVYASDGESSRINGKNKISKRQKEAKEVAKNAKIKKIFFLNYPDNQMDKINILKISKSITSIVDKVKPDIVYTHHYNDLNIDHKITFEATMVACRPIRKKNITEIYSFEILSSSEWHGRQNLNFKPNVYVNINNFFQKKISLMKIYKNEVMRSPHPRSIRSITSKAASRGSEVNTLYAEAFELIRIIK